jgi:hypothetical protein
VLAAGHAGCWRKPAGLLEQVVVVGGLQQPPSQEHKKHCTRRKRSRSLVHFFNSTLHVPDVPEYPILTQGGVVGGFEKPPAFLRKGVAAWWWFEAAALRSARNAAIGADTVVHWAVHGACFELSSIAAAGMGATQASAIVHAANSTASLCAAEPAVLAANAACDTIRVLSVGVTESLLAAQARAVNVATALVVDTTALVLDLDENGNVRAVVPMVAAHTRAAHPL